MKPFSLYIRLCLLCLGITTFTSCNLFTKEEPIDCPSQTEYYYLDAEAKAQIPYKGYDTIRMVSNTGDTLHFIGKGKQPFTTQDFELYGNPACGNNGTTKVYEAYKIVFVNQKMNTESLTITHYSKFIQTSQSAQPNHVTVKYGENIFNTTDFQISNTHAESYHGDIDINGKTYLKTNKILRNYTDSSAHLLLNKNNGIIRISLNNNTLLWNLY